jgi:hypothetical protein
VAISFGGDEIQTSGYADCGAEDCIFRRKIIYDFDACQIGVESIGEMKPATSPVAVTF